MKKYFYFLITMTLLIYTSLTFAFAKPQRKAYKLTGLLYVSPSQVSLTINPGSKSQYNFILNKREELQKYFGQKIFTELIDVEIKVYEIKSSTLAFADVISFKKSEFKKSPTYYSDLTLASEK